MSQLDHKYTPSAFQVKTISLNWWMTKITSSHVLEATHVIHGKFRGNSKGQEHC